MKTYILLILLFPIVLNAQESVLDLNAENLTLLALKNSPPEIVEAFVIKRVKSDHAKEYYHALKNKTGTEGLIERARQNLEDSLLEVSTQQTFKFSKAIKYTVVKNQLATIRIHSLFPGVVHSIHRGYDSQEGLPSHYKLLLANLEILNAIKINQSMLTTLQQEQQNSIWAEATLLVSKYQNQQDFQAVIKRIDLYKDKTKSQLLISLTEDRNHNDIVDNWLLSDGFTTKLAGIHAFSVKGYRLQDRISKGFVLGKICEKSIKVSSHQVILCLLPFTKNSKVVTIYIGGILAQMDLLVNNKLDANETKVIVGHLLHGLKVKMNFLLGEQKKWTKYSVDFSFSPSAFKVLESADLSESSMYRLLFSMKSQATSKLFEVKQ